MTKFIITLTAIFLGTLSSSGQSKKELLDMMNNIKNQTETYYWAQYTHPDGNTAMDNATLYVLSEINSNRTGKEKMLLEELTPLVKSIKIDRGNLKQIFVYVKKTDVLALNGTISTKPSSPSTTTNTVVVSTTTTGATTISSGGQRKSYVPDAFVQRILQAQNFNNVNRLLRALQGEKQILQFGKLRDVDNYDSFELILFDMKSQEVITLLSPVTHGSKRTNLVTGTEDSLDNYPEKMTAVIWYIK